MSTITSVQSPVSTTSTVPTTTELLATIQRLEAQVQAMADLLEVTADTVGNMDTAVHQIHHVQSRSGSSAPRLGAGVLGYSSAAILRWMGAQGWTNKQAMSVVMSYGIDISPATVQTQRQLGRKGYKVPALTDDQATQLCTHLASYNLSD